MTTRDLDIDNENSNPELQIWPSQMEGQHTTTMSEEATEKKTLGEELFLVHLSRLTHTLPTADDFDHEDRKQRDTDRRPSIGEELWHVHCKRAVGTIMDEDLDDDNLKAPAKKSATKKQVQKVFQEPHEGAQAKVDDKVIHHLRNRDVTIE